MRTIVKGKNMDVPEHVRRYAEKRFHRLERLLDDRSDAVVELSVERPHKGDASHLVEVNLVIDGRTLRGHAAAVTHEAGIDTVVDRLERQAVDFKAKPRDRARPAKEGGIPAHSTDAAARPARDPRIVKVKRFAIEPMFEEDALARMDELGHTFYIFVNAENERVSVLYRRTDGGYGVIEPVVAGQYTPGESRKGEGAGRGSRPAREDRR